MDYEHFSTNQEKAMWIKPYVNDIIECSRCHMGAVYGTILWKDGEHAAFFRDGCYPEICPFCHAEMSNSKIPVYKETYEAQRSKNLSGK